jgi:hypothetical protein
VSSADRVLPYVAVASGTVSTILGAINLGSVWQSGPEVSGVQKCTAAVASVTLIGLGVALSTLGSRELRYLDRDLLLEED